MKLPHRIENQYEFIDGDNTITYDASLERLAYKDGRLTGAFTLGIDISPTVDPDLTGVSRVIAKVASEFKSRCVYVGSGINSEPLTLTEGGRICPDPIHMVMEKLEARGMEVNPTRIDIVYSPLEDRLIRILQTVEE